VLITLFLLHCFAGVTLAQASIQTAREQERQRLILYALSTIRQVAAEAQLWNERETAASVLADAADSYWDDDPSQSGKWLEKAWEIANQVSAIPRDERLKEFFTSSAQSELRTTVLRVARKHDPKLADKFLKQLSEKGTDEKKERGAFDDRTGRSEQLLSMAQQVVDSNPEEAFALAVESLADGLSYKLQNVLTSIRKENVQLANRLFDLALARFRSSLPDPSEAQILAGYLFQPGYTFSANSSGREVLVVNPAQQNLTAVASSEPQRAKSYLSAVYQRLLTQAVALNSPEGKERAQQLLILGNLVGRHYAVFAPELAPSAQGFLAQLRRQLMPESEGPSASGTSPPTSDNTDTTKRLTKEELYEKRIAELEASADKESNALFRNVAYIKVTLTTNPDDYDRAKQIAQKIDDLDLRADAISFVLYRAALFFISKADVTKAIDIAPTISEPLRKAVVRIAIAQTLLSSKSATGEPGEAILAQQRALDLLDDLDRELKKENASSNAARILLGRTAVLAKLNQDQALTSLEQAVQMINKLDQFDLRNGTAPSLGIGAVSTSGATVATPRIGFDFRSAIDPLIDADFEQVSAIAGRLTAKERNGLARLEAAKLYLRKNRHSTVKESTAVIR
jgi:TPR repeat protein